MVDWLETKLLGFRYSTLLCRAVRCDRSTCHCGDNLWRCSAAGDVLRNEGGKLGTDRESALLFIWLWYQLMQDFAKMWPFRAVIAVALTRQYRRWPCGVSALRSLAGYLHPGAPNGIQLQPCGDFQAINAGNESTTVGNWYYPFGERDKKDLSTLGWQRRFPI